MSERPFLLKLCKSEETHLVGHTVKSYEVPKQLFFRPTKIIVKKEDPVTAESCKYFVLGSFWGRFRIVLDRFGIVLESFWARFGIGLESFWCRFGIVLGAFWDRFGIVSGLVLESVWGRFVFVLTSFWGRSGIVLGPFWGNPGTQN